MSIGNIVIIFLDTEFTDLVVYPRLLSVGLVAGCTPDIEFYGEMTDRDRLDAACGFVQRRVLPQFGAVERAACSYFALGHRLAEFLSQLIERLSKGELIELAFGHHLDWDLISLALQQTSNPYWMHLQDRLLPVNVYQTTGFGIGAVAADTYFKAQVAAPLSRHHALCDARALRLAYEAAMGFTQDFRPESVGVLRSSISERLPASSDA